MLGAEDLARWGESISSCFQCSFDYLPDPDSILGLEEGEDGGGLSPLGPSGSLLNSLYKRLEKGMVRESCQWLVSEPGK